MKRAVILVRGTREPMRDVIVGSAPFIVLQFAMVLALYWWPTIAMYLPRLVIGG